MHGSGDYTFHDGSSYRGQYELGKRHGQGKFNSSNGSTYNGEWADGMKHGQGREKNTETGLVYEGKWEQDVAVLVATRLKLAKDVREAEAPPLNADEEGEG